MGYHLVDRIADFLESLPERPVSPGESPEVIRDLIRAPLPEQGASPTPLLDEAANLLFDHSVFNGHPRFWGYITSSAAPIGALAELLAAAVNPNVGGWMLAPIATEIEAQTVRWIAEMIGYPAECGGLLVSGGNMANFVAFLAARTAKAPWDIRTEGLLAGRQPLRVYASRETHTWIQKATDLFGLGTDAISWIPTDDAQQMDVDALEEQIVADQEKGYLPFLVVGAAGTVSTGAVDPLSDIADICRKYELWFHVDGAYGAFAAILPHAPDNMSGMREADSVALDPHKWLYSPLEAGCTLVRNPQHLLDAYSFHPEYYHFDENVEESPVNYYEYGPQNSRGFRALKVWLALRQVGRDGYAQMIGDDIKLAQDLCQLVDSHEELEAFTHNLSITTFRYVPNGLTPGREAIEAYLDELNRTLLTDLMEGGEVFLSNAVIGGKFVLRACIVNFRTTLDDIEALPGIVARRGRALDAEMRPVDLRDI
ncbi:MAG: aminotransferase class V-fold PLP-dependent enzyme [Chloroflexota bacterium]|nr:aminotransferase class V-fold PLP-dependent enzyme [Chloroflexota bacterium]